MKRVRMKGKTVEGAIEAALAVVGGEREKAKVFVLSEGKAGVLGVIGVVEAEVEVVLKQGQGEDAKQVLQEILDKMRFLAVAEGKEAEGGVELNIKGEDLGRIIGKDGATLKALEVVAGAIISRLYEEKVRVSVDAGDYQAKRQRALERLAQEAAEEVAETGKGKVLPALDAKDRRVVHMFLKDNPRVTSFSEGEGKGRRLVIAPR